MPKRKPMLKIVKFQHISLLKNSQKRKHEEHPYFSKTEKKNVNCISSTSEICSNDFHIQTDEYGCYNNEPVVELVTYDNGTTIIFDETEHQADTLCSRLKKPATYDDGPTITFDETAHQADTLASKLSKWATSCNIQHTHLSKLLKILAEEDIQHLPRDARTLLSTPLLTEKSHIKPLDNGQYLHFGVENYLHKMLDSLKENVSAPISALHLSFNIDGTPISISGSTSFWMISGCVHNLIDIIQPKAFVVGIFKAFGKPDSYNNFLEDFVNEMENLLKKGILHNLKYYEIKFHSCVCDAPAMASIKQIKSHGGYYCCSKCFTKGISIKTKKGKVIVYPEIKAPLRSDVNFRNRKTINGEHDKDHHKSNHSILERLPIDMITQFPLDKMHLVDEGVCKRLIQIWLGKPGPQKLRSEKVQILNKRLELCYFYSCSEFQRKTRTLHFANYLKASELRVFLLYTGPVVLKNILCKSTYKHFLCLSLAIRILTSPIYYRRYNEFAEDLLIYFVKHFPVLYGLSNVTYNVHGLIHIAKDAFNLGPLDENSCYKFESYIKIIKKMLHCSLRPLEQCYNRVYEINEANNVAASVSQNGAPILSKNMFGTDKYKICVFHNFKINTTTLNDNCIMLRDGHAILRVKYFEKNSSNISIFGQKLINVEALNKEPNGLTEFFMVIGKFDEHVSKYQIKDLKLEVLCKMCCFPYDNSRFFLSPLNHTLADI